MNPIDFCLTNHLNKDPDLPLRFCKLCHKAMCEICYEHHKGHDGICCTLSSNQNAATTDDDEPPSKKTKQMATPGLEITPTLQIVNGRFVRCSTRDKTATIVYPQCTNHCKDRDQFCTVHCTLICQQCKSESHKTCFVISAVEACRQLDETSVSELRKCLNKIRVDCIEVKTLLSKNVTSLGKQKQAAIKELKAVSDQAISKINKEYEDTKSDIENMQGKYISENCGKICHLNNIMTKIDEILKDAKMLENQEMNVGLFLKFQDILSRNNEVTSDMPHTFSNIRKMKLLFKGNKRFQPFSSNSKLGKTTVTASSCSSVNTPTPFVFPMSVIIQTSKASALCTSSVKQQNNNPQSMAVRADQVRSYTNANTAHSSSSGNTNNTESSLKHMPNQVSAKNCGVLQHQPQTFGSDTSGTASSCRNDDTTEPPLINGINHVTVMTCQENPSDPNAVRLDSKCLYTNATVLSNKNNDTIESSLVKGLNLSTEMNRQEHPSQTNTVGSHLERSYTNDIASSYRASDITESSWINGINLSAEMNSQECSSQAKAVISEPERLYTNATASINIQNDINESSRINGINLVTEMNSQECYSQAKAVISEPERLYSNPTASINRYNDITRSSHINGINHTLTAESSLSNGKNLMSEKNHQKFISPSQAEFINSKTMMPQLPDMSSNGFYASLSAKRFQNIQNIQAELVDELYVGRPSPYCIGSIDVATDGRIVYVAYKTVFMITADRKTTCLLDIKVFLLYGVTVYNDTTAVASSRNTFYVVDISGTPLRLKKTVHIEFVISCIKACENNLLVACSQQSSVKLISINGEVLWSASSNHYSGLPFRMACYKDQSGCRVLVTDTVYDSMTVLNGNTGDVIETFCLDREGLRGITVDADHNIYMSFSYTKEIVVFNRDMTSSNVLIDTDGCTHALAFDVSKNQLIVGYYTDNKLGVYQLSET